MNSHFRRYSSMTSPGEASEPVRAEASPPLPAKKDFQQEKSLFGEMRGFIMGLSLKGSGPRVAVFDYGYFGGEDDENYKGSGGGSSSGGGSKLTSDSKQAPSPFSSVFGGGN